METLLILADLLLSLALIPMIGMLAVTAMIGWYILVTIYFRNGNRRSY